MKQAGDDAIIIKDLIKKFGTFTAVDNISFSVKKGEVFGFLGANGAGKTTAIRMICGLLEPTSGDIRVGGISVREAPGESQTAYRLHVSEILALYRFKPW